MPIVGQGQLHAVERVVKLGAQAVTVKLYFHRTHRPWQKTVAMDQAEDRMLFRLEGSG